MLRMPLRLFSSGVGLVLAIALAQLPVVGKCLSMQLNLNGTIEGLTSDLKVVVEVSSATQGDSVTDVRRESSVGKSSFRVLAWFNTTSHLVAAETCDRRPHLVTVKLVRGDLVLDQVVLTIETDFRRTKTGDYELKKAIALHAAQSAN